MPRKDILAEAQVPTKLTDLAVNLHYTVRELTADEQEAIDQGDAVEADFDLETLTVQYFLTAKDQAGKPMPQQLRGNLLAADVMPEEEPVVTGFIERVWDQFMQEMGPRN